MSAPTMPVSCGRRPVRGAIQDIRHGDGDGLRGRKQPIGGTHDDVIDIVGAGIRRRLEVRRRQERQRAGRAG